MDIIDVAYKLYKFNYFNKIKKGITIEMMTENKNEKSKEGREIEDDDDE